MNPTSRAHLDALAPQVLDRRLQFHYIVAQLEQIAENLRAVETQLARYNDQLNREYVALRNRAIPEQS